MFLVSSGVLLNQSSAAREVLTDGGALRVVQWVADEGL
ncbi:hypothetical protein Psch_00997 [Pelotomaculum schinkii]|uniref:Uncharacterized protein n=1 Tax=Pelotomaculum schinkii TaxID=78350 RepID=A0A4Y7RF82_9FIRM|nr:hypothetical protein Psch_00997 [Pelotomaculum schinkii]TEB17355.1 hypothetical protein Psfp_00579 [Pelotomaculum sp. FP]